MIHVQKYIFYNNLQTESEYILKSLLFFQNFYFYHINLSGSIFLLKFIIFQNILNFRVREVLSVPGTSFFLIFKSTGITLAYNRYHFNENLRFQIISKFLSKQASWMF